MNLRRRLSRHSADVVMGLLVTIVALESILAFPAVLLAIKLNVFAVPLAWYGVLSFPLWAWYVISLLWVSQTLYYLNVDVSTALITAYQRVPSPHDVRGYLDRSTWRAERWWWG